VDREWRYCWKSWSDSDVLVHPDSPAGGAGPGQSRRPGPLGCDGNSAFSSSALLSSNVPHPSSPTARLFQFHLPQIDVLERARAVYDALSISKDYIPDALKEATGQELYAVVQGIIPALLLALGVMAVTTAIGAAAGAALGALAGGVGAVPGAAIGAGVGFDAGLFLLNVLGLGFLIAYIGASLVKAAQEAGEAARLAWGAVDQPNLRDLVVDSAAHKFAEAVALVFRGVLQGVVAFLLAKGTAAAAARVGELVGKLKASKIGTDFAEWVQRNWRGLLDEPKLQPEGSMARAAAAGEGGGLATLKAAGEARRTQSYKDIDAYQKDFEARETAAREVGDNRRAGGYKSKVTEAIGERAATEYMETNYPDFVMNKGFGKPGSGFDQVYTKYNEAGNPVEIMVVEAKGPGATLATDAAKGPQMSNEWVKNTVPDMIKSDDPGTKALGKTLRDALDNGEPPLTGKVIQAVEGGGAQELPLPPGPVYNAGRYN